MATRPWISGNPWDRHPPILTMRLHVNDSSRTHDHRPPPVRRRPTCLTPPTNRRGIWLLPATTHSTGATGAFHTTTPRSPMCARSLPHELPRPRRGRLEGLDGRSSEAGTSVTCFDVLAIVFSQSSTFRAIRITSDPSTLDLGSVTSTHGFRGTLSQTVPAVFTAKSIPAAGTLAAKNNSVPPNGIPRSTASSAKWSVGFHHRRTPRAFPFDDLRRLRRLRLRRRRRRQRSHRGGIPITQFR